MKLRTTSDLQAITSVQDTDLLEITKQLQSKKYASKKITYQNLKQDIVDKSELQVKTNFNLSAADQVNLKSLDQFCHQLSASIGIEQNTIKFLNSPLVEHEDIRENAALQTKQQIKSLVGDYSDFITPGSFITVDFSNDGGSTSISNNKFDQIYYWKIDNGLFDSSESINMYGKKLGPVEINPEDQGYMTIYGWLASSANVAPQNAWVGLYGYLPFANTNSSRWVLLQLQPWIIGQSAQVMQYVGFNIPVKPGLKLKIMTGFPVNGTNSGFQSTGHSLLLEEQGNVVNSFVGYVLRND